MLSGIKCVSIWFCDVKLIKEVCAIITFLQMSKRREILSWDKIFAILNSEDSELDESLRGAEDLIRNSPSHGTNKYYMIFLRVGLRPSIIRVK